MPPKLESGSKTAAGHFWCLGVLLVFGIVFYHRVLFLGEVLTGGDQNYLHYAWKVYFVDSIREGVFPFWNPYPFCGAPFFHDIQTATLYPPDWVYFFLPLPWALGFSHFLHTVLAGWFFYFLSGKFLSEKKARLFTSLSYMASGFVSSRLLVGNAGLMDAYCWMPLFFLCGIRLADRPSVRRVGAFALVAALFILAGHPQLPFLAVQLLGVYVLFRLFAKRAPLSASFKKLGFLLGGGLLGLLVVSVQVGPFLQLAGFSATRAGGASYTFAAEGSMPISHLPTLLLPFFYGDPTQETFWENLIPFPEICGYLGTFALFLIVVWLIFPKAKKGSWFWFGVGTTGLLLALGEFTPVHRLFCAAVPGWDLFRQPGRSLLLCTFAGCILAGQGLEALLAADAENSKKPFGRLTLLFPAAFIVLVLATGFVMVREDAILESFAAAENLKAMSHSGNLESRFVPGNFQHRHEAMVSSLAVGAVFTGLFGILLILFWKKEVWRPTLASVVILVAALDLFWFGHRFLGSISQNEWRNRFFPRSEVARELAAEATEGRLLIPDDALDYRTRNRHPEIYPNGPMVYGIRTVRGYSATILRHYSEFINLMQSKPPHEPPGGLLILEDVRKMDPLALRVIGVTSAVDYKPLPPPFQLEKRYSDGLFLFRLPGSLPRCFRARPSENRWRLEPVERDNDSTTLLESSPNRVVARTEGNEPSLLVFSDCSFPGWKATVNGTEVPIKTTFHAFQGVPVPAGECKVIWEFRPSHWRLYVALSLAALLLTAALLVKKPGA